MFKQGRMTTTAHLLSVRHRRLEQLLEVCILGLVLVSCCSPLSNGLPMEDQDLHKIKSFTSSCDLEQPTWKKVSMSKIRSGWIELVSSKTGSGGPEKL